MQYVTQHYDSMQLHNVLWTAVEIYLAPDPNLNP